MTIQTSGNNINVFVSGPIYCFELNSTNKFVQKLKFKGYVYVCGTRKKNKNPTYWACDTVNKCKGTCFTTPNGDVITSGSHCHGRPELINIL